VKLKECGVLGHRSNPERAPVSAAKDDRRAASEPITRAAPDRDGGQIAIGDIENAGSFQAETMRPELEPARVG
jgi:hypothetical protein